MDSLLKKLAVYFAVITTLHMASGCNAEAKIEPKERTEEVGTLSIDANSNQSYYGFGLYDRAEFVRSNTGEEEFNYKLEENVIWKGQYNNTFTVWIDGKDSTYFKMFVDKNQNGIWNEEISGSIILGLEDFLTYPEILPSFLNYARANINSLNSNITVRNLDEEHPLEQEHLVYIVNNYIERTK